MINKIKLVKAFFKRHWYKFLSVFCAFAVAFVTSLSSFVFASSVSFADLILDIAAVSPVGAVVDYANLISDVYLFFFEDAVTSDREIQRTKILAAWKTITDNSTMTEDQFADYWQQCIDELGLADDRLIMIEETVRLGFTLEDVINHCYHSDGDGVSVSDTGDVQVTGRKFKQIVDYWHDYYKPKDKSPTASRIYWTTQSSDVPEGFQSYLTNGDFDMPLFCTSTNKNGFLGLDWSDLYLLPYVETADSNGLLQYYYGRYTWHFYIARNDDNLPYLQIDVISLDTSEVSASYTFLKSSTDYPFSSYSNLRFRSNFSTTYYACQLKGFTSYLDMIAGDMSFTQPESFYKDLLTSYSSLYSGSISSLSSYSFNSSTLSSSSDFGYICQNEMFELWANDTSIDTSKIPDDYVVTVTGDTVYDYSITNTAGDTSTINNYITNNYSIPSSGSGSDSASGSGSSDGSVSGNVTVSGDIGVNGSVDINVNVNSDSSTSPYLPSYDDYVDNLPDKTDTLSDYLNVAFDFLPPEVLGLLLGGVATAIICLIFKR